MGGCFAGSLPCSETEQGMVKDPSTPLRVDQTRKSLDIAMQPRHKFSYKGRNRHAPTGKYADYAPRVIAYGLLALALLLVGIGVATAHEFTAGGVTVTHPWARATPGGAKVGGAYLEMKAAKGKGDRLIAVRSAVAGSAELHTHIMDGGIARMRRVDAIAVPGGKSVILKPSGHHLMLMDLKGPLKEGDLLKFTLVFEKAGEIEVEATVEPIGAMGPHGFDHQPGTTAGEHKH